MYTTLKFIKALFGCFGTKFDGVLVFGLYEDETMSSVTKTIEGLRVSGFWTKAICGGLMYGSITTIALVALYLSRGADFQYRTSEFSWLFVAHLWAYLGPPLIWYHEKHSQSEFFKRSSLVIESEIVRSKIKIILFSNLNNHSWIKWSRFAWIVIAIIAFLYFHEFYKKLGISGLNDVWFFILFLGVVVFANYTSIGIGRVLTSLWAVWTVNESEPTSRRRHLDNHLGYSFMTDFTAKTCALFSTGALFFPLIYRLSVGTTPLGVFLPYLLIGIVVLLILLSLLIPILWTAGRIRCEKNKLLKENYIIFLDKEKEYISKRTQDTFNSFVYQRSVCDDILSTKLWPLQSDSIAKFIPTFASLIIGFISLQITS